MTKNIENIENTVKIETQGFQALCSRFGKLEEENKKLKADNKVIGDELTYFKELCGDLEEEITSIKARCRKLNARNMELESEIADMRFTRKFLTGEEAGAMFARELLGKPMSTEEVAIEAAENCYVPYTGDDF